MLLTASANAAEIAVVAKHLSEQDVAWQRWTLDDSSRAEMPMTNDFQETFPVGMALDVTSQTPIALGDNRTHPACPILLLLSTDGVVSAFHMMYMRSDAPSVQRPSVGALDPRAARVAMSEFNILPVPQITILSVCNEHFFQIHHLQLHLQRNQLLQLLLQLQWLRHSRLLPLFRCRHLDQLRPDSCSERRVQRHLHSQ